MSSIEFCSFRDPCGVVLKYNSRIFRLIRKEYEHDFRATLENPLIHDLIHHRLIPASKLLSDEEFTFLGEKLPAIDHVKYSDFSIGVEHKTISFPSYPYEWVPEMLHCAGQLTLDLCSKLLSRNMGIKDANPYNILFLGPNPIFVDLLSFEKRNPLNHIWLPYGQFVRTFLLPLIVNKHNRTPLNQIFFNNHDGLESEDVFKSTSKFKLIKSGIFSLVTLPTLLSRLTKLIGNNSKIYQNRSASSTEMADFILKRIFKGLKRHLNKLSPVPQQSKWFDYFAKGESYSDKEFRDKETVVLKFLKQAEPKRLLDIGCNTGHFSIMAAQNNASVVAIDSDPAVISALWREARKNNLDILPLVVDISRPSPSTGWRNNEYLSFLDRSQGAFDTVLMLAVLHHLLISSQIPLEKIAKLCSEITTCNLIIEFILPQDPMFQKIVRGRDSLYAHFTLSYFEAIWKQHFNLLAKEQSCTHRWIYHFEKKC